MEGYREAGLQCGGASLVRLSSLRHYTITAKRDDSRRSKSLALASR
jgi:hypothetical protein